MKLSVNFKINLDPYRADNFPKFLEQVPRKGDMVAVNAHVKQWFEQQNLPTELEVVRVVWADSYKVVCELWYTVTDLNNK